MHRIFGTVLFLLVFFYDGLAQPELDSLRQIAETQEGKAKVDALNQICWKLRNYDAAQALSYGQKAIEYAEEIDYQKGLAVAYSFSGVVFRNLGNYVDAFAYYTKGLKLSQQEGLHEQEGYGHINLANLYIYQNDPEKSLKHLRNAQHIADSLKDTGMQAYVHVNFGRAYTKLNRFVEAEYHLWRAYHLRGELGDKDDQAVALKYIGDAKREQQQYDSALYYYDQVLSSSAARNDLDLIADASNQSAKVYLRKEKADQAQKLGEKSLEISRQVGSKLRIRDAYVMLAKVAEREQNYQQLAHFRKQIILYNDSLFNSELTRKIANLEASAARQKQKAELRLQKLETQREKTFGNALLAVLALVAFLLGFALYANKKRNRANKDLREKNHEIEAQHEELQQYSHKVTAQRDHLNQLNEKLSEKQRDIMDSINYAQRIQKAALPDTATFAQPFTDYFVLNRPRNVVSGDFYWLGTCGNKTLLAVADCTGHGVPGAFMSMLGIAFLNQVLSENTQAIRNNTIQASTMLDQLRDKVKESLHQESQDEISRGVKDGIDMSLCMIDLKKRELQFAGALSTGLLVQKDDKLISLRGDRMPVGVYPKEKPFQTHTYAINPGDRLYLFTDGYPDQMGGEEGRKFLLARLKKLVLEHTDKPMGTQQKALEERLHEWQGKHHQTDDILFVGVVC